MQQGKLFEVFSRIEKSKKELKEIKAMYRDALNNNGGYQRSLEELKKLKEEKKKYEISIKEQFASEFDKMEILKNEIENDKMLLSDIAISKVSKGEKIELQDEYENNLEPIFSVRFRKY